MMLLTDQHGHQVSSATILSAPFDTLPPLPLSAPIPPSLRPVPPVQILATIGFDWLMFITAILGHVVKTKTLATFWLAVSWAAFYFLVVRLDSLFRRAAAAATVLVERATRLSEDMARDQVTAAAANPAKAVAAAAPSAEAAEAAEAEVGLEAFRGSARTTLRMISHAHWLMFIILPTFGLNDVIASTSLAPLSWTENFWGLLDVSAKVLFASALSMTGLVTEDEAEKQRAWLAGQRAVSYSRAAARRSEELQKELKDRTETLSTLCQEGWGLVVRSFMQQGAIPEVVVSATGEAVDPRLPQVPEREPVVAELPPTADGARAAKCMRCMAPDSPACCSTSRERVWSPAFQCGSSLLPRVVITSPPAGGMGLPHASAAMLTDGGYRSSSEYSRSSDSSATGSSVGGAAHQHMRQRGAKHPQQPRAGSDNGAVAAAEEMANYGAY